ncbi:hypothetical protein M0805_006825 [Coniferiporia weirii]|nr:hypothetical protein M0805_006825 [Coniferiporia weirii]
MPLIRCRDYDEDGKPVRGGCPRLGKGCEFVHPSEPAWQRALRKVGPHALQLFAIINTTLETYFCKRFKGFLGFPSRGAPETGHWRGGPASGPGHYAKKHSSRANDARSADSTVAGPSSSWNTGSGSRTTGGSWGDVSGSWGDSTKGGSWGDSKASSSWGDSKAGTSWVGSKASTSWGDSKASTSWGDSKASTSWGDSKASTSWGDSKASTSWGDSKASTSWGDSKVSTSWGDAVAGGSWGNADTELSWGGTAGSWGGTQADSSTSWDKKDSSEKWGGRDDNGNTDSAREKKDEDKKTEFVRDSTNSNRGQSVGELSRGSKDDGSDGEARSAWGSASLGWNQCDENSKDSGTGQGDTGQDIGVSWGGVSGGWGITGNPQGSGSCAPANESTEVAAAWVGAVYANAVSCADPNIPTNGSSRGPVAASTPLEPPSKPADKGKWKVVSGASAASTSLSMSRRLFTVDSGVVERERKRPRVDLAIASSMQDLNTMVAGTPRSATAPVSAIPQSEPTLASPIPMSPAARRLNLQTTPRPDTPDAGPPASRSPSLTPVDGISAQEPRALSSVSYKQARSFWHAYARHISRLIRIRKEWSDIQGLQRDYRTAQNSPVYVKTGNRGSTLLNQEHKELKLKEQKLRDLYADALTGLCTFEDSFDFPVRLLVERKQDKDKLNGEIASLRGYMQEVKAYVDSTRNEIEEIDPRVQSASAPQPVAASPVDDVNVLKKASDVLSILEAKKIPGRVDSLEKAASEFEQILEEINSGTNIQDFVHHKFEEFRSSLRDTLDLDRDDEQDELSEQLPKLKQDHSMTRADLQAITNDVGDLSAFLKELEKNVSERDAEHPNTRTLDEDRAVLMACEKHGRDCAAFLAQSTAELEHLRGEFTAIKNRPPNTSLLSEVGLPQKVMDKLSSVLTSAVQERTRVDTETALEAMKSKLAVLVKEHNEEQVRALTAALAPLYRLSHEVQMTLERKGVLTRPRRPM